MLANQTEKQIAKFFDFYRRRVDFVDRFCVENGRPTIEAYILLCSYLDALAGYRYVSECDRKSFNDFVLTHSGLKTIYEKVS